MSEEELAEEIAARARCAAADGRLDDAERLAEASRLVAYPLLKRWRDDGWDVRLPAGYEG